MLRYRAAALQRQRGNSRSLPTESELAKTARRPANTCGAQKPCLALGMTPQRRGGRRGGRGSINSPVSGERSGRGFFAALRMTRIRLAEETLPAKGRSEEHTSELQSRLHLVCRLLLEKKKKKQHNLIKCRVYTE